MTYSFRPARRSEAKPLVGLYAESGNGKTFSALLLARGFVGPQGKIGMIETEGGRGEVFVGTDPVGHYDVVSLRQDFSPQAYGEAITAAENAKLDALIVDSASHEWEGAGGVLAMAADNQANGKKGVLVWQQPKIHHQRHFMLRLMQTPIPLVIVCMRAKYPMKEVPKRGGGGKEWVRADQLEPKQADDILYEMFIHGWIDAEHRFHGTKYTLPELEQVIRDGEPISIETGQRLAAWSKGEDRPATASPSQEKPAEPSGGGPPQQSGPTEAPAPAPFTPEDFEQYVMVRLEDPDATPESLKQWWNSDRQKQNRKGISADLRKSMQAKVVARIEQLEQQPETDDV